MRVASLRLTAHSLCASLCLSALGASAFAQDRPSEADLFGAPSTTEPEAAEADAGVPERADELRREGMPPAAANAEEVSRISEIGDARDAVLGERAQPMFTEEPAPSDPLTIGGQVYLRLQSGAYEDTPVSRWGVSAPALLDVYMDARPNDRVRGFALGRMSYDPLLPASTTNLNASSTNASGGTAGSTSIAPLFGGATNAPRVLLDQLWLRFDIAHTLFVTAGRQHVRWGTARFWMPADFLHVRKRNPLDVFDARQGTTMVKLHLPIESRAWNFYAYGITENEGGQPDLRTPAGALRAEFVLDQFELGLGAYGRASSRAKFAADLSFGLGDVDFYSELALIDGRTIDRVGYNPGATVSKSNMGDSKESLPEIAGLDEETLAVVQAQTARAVQLARAQSEADMRYPAYRNPGYRPQIVVGLNYTRKYADNDTFTVGVEYFYNAFGYKDPAYYSGVLWPHTQPLQNAASFFYLGQHYGALFITFPAPFKLDLHTFTLSTLGNLSDRSFTSRFDYSLVLLTHLRFDAYAAVAYGARGEFRFKVADLQTVTAQELGFPNKTSVFTLGFGLRLAI